MGNENYKKLGIIGGLGPAATATLFARVIDLTEAETDQDHLDITILNRPQTPDRTAFILGKAMSRICRRCTRLRLSRKIWDARCSPLRV